MLYEKMEVGPPEPSCRRRLQTAVSCFSQKLRWWTSTVKRRDVRSRHVWIREVSANDPPMKHRNILRRHQNQGLPLILGAAWQVPTYWPCGVRCTGGTTLISIIRSLVRAIVLPGNRTHVPNLGRSHGEHTCFLPKKESLCFRLG